MKTVLGGWGRVLSVGASIVVLKWGQWLRKTLRAKAKASREKIKEWQEKDLGRLPRQLAATAAG